MIKGLHLKQTPKRKRAELAVTMAHKITLIMDQETAVKIAFPCSKTSL